MFDASPQIMYPPDRKGGDPCKGTGGGCEDWRGEMGLAKLIGTIASHEELVTLLEALEADNINLRSAIEWALGERGDFPPKPEGGKPYWWRTELRKRSRGV